MNNALELINKYKVMLSEDWVPRVTHLIFT